MLVRVFDVDGEAPKVWFVPDPWASSELKFVSPVHMLPAGRVRGGCLEAVTYENPSSVQQATEGGGRERRGSSSLLDTVP